MLVTAELFWVECSRYIPGDKAGVSPKRFYRQLISKADELYDRHLAKINPKKKR
jgi:hypothetical protein